MPNDALLPIPGWDILCLLYDWFVWFYELFVAVSAFHDALGKALAPLARHVVEHLVADASRFLGTACVFLFLVPLVGFLGYCAARLLLRFAHGQRATPRHAHREEPTRTPPPTLDDLARAVADELRIAGVPFQNDGLHEYLDAVWGRMKLDPDPAYWARNYVASVGLDGDGWWGG